MSKYTTEVRYICENYAGLLESEGYNSIDTILDSAIPKVFDFDYPIFDVSYKNVLERKILKHYYTREIGAETVGLWKLWLNTKMNEIMPYYNEMYATVVHDFNPQYEVDYWKIGDVKEKNTVENTGTVTHEGTNTGTVTDNATHTGTVEDAARHTGTVEDETTHTGTVEDETTHTGTVEDEATHTGTVGTKTDDTTTRTDELQRTRKYSDTPQGGTTGLDNDGYLTNYTKENDTGTQTHVLDGNSTTTNDLTDTNTRTNDLTDTNTRTNDLTDTNTRTNNLTDTNTRVNDLTDTNTRTNDLANTDTRTDDTKSDIKNNRDYEEHVYGIMNGSNYFNMIQKFRELIVNIDMMIIDDLKDLFFGLW